MKALSLWQPWAHFMALGLKTIETRHWNTNYRGPLAIHASKRPLSSDEENLLAMLRADYDGFDFSEREMAFGALVAIVDFVECKRVEDVRRGLYTYDEYGKPDGVELEYELGNYLDGRFAWLTRDLHRIETPIPFRGRQGLFTVTLPDCLSVVAA